MSETKEFDEAALAEFIDALCKGGDRMLDASLKPRLQALKGNRPRDEVRDELYGIMGDCRFASLSSGFVIMTLDAIWRLCGGTDEELKAIHAAFDEHHKAGGSSGRYPRAKFGRFKFQTIAYY